MGNKAPIALALGSLFAFSAGDSGALGLADIETRSALGERLVATIDVVGADGAVDPGCFRLHKPPVGPADEVPVLRNGKASLRRRGDGYQLVVTSDRPINDPVLEIGVEVGCGTELVRHFTVLLSPPDVSPPVVAVAEPVVRPVAEPPAEARPVRSVKPRHVRRGRAGVGGAGGGVPAVAVTTAKAGASQDGRLTSTAPEAAAGGDRLVIAGTRSEGSGLPAESDDARIRRKIDEARSGVAQLRQHLDANFPAGGDPALDKTLAAVQERLAALQQRLDAMQGPSAEAAGRPAAPVVEAPASPPSPPASPAAAEQPVKEASGGSSWWLPLLLAVLGIGGGAFLAYRNRGRRQASEPEEQTSWRMPLLKREPAKLETDESEGQAAGSRPPMGDSGVEGTRWPTTKGGGVASGMRSVKLEEVSEADSILELAELLVSYGRLKSAAEALQEFINAKPREALQPWVKLLDIYRRMGRRDEFERLAADLNRTFNVERVAWEEDSRAIAEALTEAPVGGNRPASLEGFPHLAERLVSSWGTRECLTFLEDLLHDNREGAREGFSLPVIQEIVLLIGILERRLGPAPKPELPG